MIRFCSFGFFLFGFKGDDLLGWVDGVGWIQSRAGFLFVASLSSKCSNSGVAYRRSMVLMVSSKSSFPWSEQQFARI